MADDAKPKRYRLADPDKKHVKAKPPRRDSDGPKKEWTDRPPRRDADGPKREWTERPPRRDGDSGPPRGPRREFGGPPSRSFGPKREWTDRPPRREGEGDGPKREWTDRPPRREFGGPPRARSFGGPPKREWTDRPPRREFGGPPRRDFGDRGPRPAGGGNSEMMEALSRIENAVKDIVKRITLIENQLDEIFDGSEEE